MAGRNLTVQQTLFQRADHSARGADFEAELNRTHHFYQIRGLAKVEKNEVEWVRTTKNQIDYALADGRISERQWARTGDGQYLIQQQSKVDYEGGGSGFSIEFDAKQTKGKSIPLTRFTPHQLRRLREAERCGKIAGFMTRFSELDRVFFLKASFVQKCVDGANLKNERKSISLGQCEESAIEVPVERNLIDWLKVLVRK